MKLSASDEIEAVYYSQNAVEQSIEYGDRMLELNKIKLGHRDSKGVKVRI